ncbi:acetylglutamate kinase [Thermospira aquatica]|uniref:Acetylglutamate kinase n=1 Tax=Thermospira aquatica TaxID=2828656 RepID=A0AAX3BF24_9SPIR|nr:acetylglutamate kinase [Thermospira aquatica]URA10948.1 acetylglutamate kinase [Thermospira aquatica]
MERYIEKARVIMEALPYIREFSKKTVVIKYGGNAMESPQLKELVMQDIALLKLVGINVVIVHGGGPAISEMMQRLGKEPKFVDGYRYTDEETMEITEMVLSGLINKELVAAVNAHGIKAVGLSGKDNRLILAKKKGPKDIGMVGEIISIQPEVVQTLIASDYVPVISPVGVGEDGKTYNINADIAAGEIAIALKAYKLIYMTDIRGIYEDINDENSFLSTVNETAINRLKKEKKISEGMIPKIDSALKAVKQGVEKVHIIDGRIEHSLLLELLTDAGIGTEIARG